MKKVAACLSAFCLFILCAAPIMAAEGGGSMENTIAITRKGSTKTIQGAESAFVGEVSVELNIPRRENSAMSGGLVTFQPGARTNWHTHPIGQLIIIVEGKGRVREWGGPVQEVFPGDLVWFPAGVKHWHGAAPDQSMAHYAVVEVLDGKSVDWMEKVSDEQYNK